MLEIAAGEELQATRTRKTRSIETTDAGQWCVCASWKSASNGEVIQVLFGSLMVRFRSSYGVANTRTQRQQVCSCSPSQTHSLALWF